MAGDHESLPPVNAEQIAAFEAQLDAVKQSVAKQNVLGHVPLAS